MKKIINILVLIYIIVTAFLLFSKKDTNEILSVDKNEDINMLSMMLETEAGSGKYKETTASSWPTDGYKFNSSLSKCEKGSNLSWDNINKKVIMEGNSADKCYIYFDIFTPLLSDYVKSQYTGIQGENNLYYHDKTLVNGANDNSYRYAGSSETTNNYICFGSNEKTCSNDNLYKIIGLFKEGVKLVKWDYALNNLLGTNGSFENTFSNHSSYYKGDNLNGDFYFWSNINGTSTTNMWSESNLNKINLNTNFINYLGSEWSNKIKNATWQVGGNSWDNIAGSTVKIAYTNELVTPTKNITNTAKIGLMYVSDYTYATSPDDWTRYVYNTENGIYKARDNNCLYVGENEYFITPNAVNSTRAFVLSGSGEIFDLVSYEMALNIRPSFYLNSDLILIGGNGTKTDPFRIK